MSDSVKNLINAISVGSAINTEEAFNSAMAEKISVKLESMRQDVAANMFATEEVVSEEHDYIFEDQYLTLSEEEKQNYEPISEEQLDEISQELAKKYHDKVINKAVKKEFPTKDSKKDLPSHIRKDLARDTLPKNRRDGVGRSLNRMAGGKDYYSSKAHTDSTVKKI